MTFKDISGSKQFRIVVLVIGALIILLLVFQAGEFVGFRKASFSYRFGDNYYRAFDSHERGFPFSEGHSEFLNPHGTVGKIVSINLPTLVVIGPDNVEKVVRINDDTSIVEFRGSIKSSDLAVNDFITVIGSPSDTSELNAKFIRVVPPAASGMMGTNTMMMRPY